MMKLRYKISLLLFPCCCALPAAAQLITNGSIKFERKTNLHQQLRVEQNAAATPMPGRQSMMSHIPQYNIAYFNYNFTARESKYVFDKKDDVNYDTYNMTGTAAKENIVYSNYLTHKAISKKNAYDTDYLIEDSLKKFTWKISDELRTIAGYLCRKATTQINDSVVVVAFYTTQIMVSGGPESFNGLPGMILGIAIPRIYTTWFATSVELSQGDTILPPDKGRKLNNAGFVELFTKNTPLQTKNAMIQRWWMTL
jgi:GLPGLI family protein